MPGRATILFAHGARDPDWARPLRQLALALAERLPGERIVLAFLELMQPSLAECAAALHAEGFRELRVVPIFLGMGGHLKQDLPAQAKAIQEKFSDLRVTLEPPIGEQPEVIEAIAKTIAR